MIKFPILIRYKQADGRWSAESHADTLEKAREHLASYRRNNYTEFEIRDASGQPFTEDQLKGTT